MRIGGERQEERSGSRHGVTVRLWREGGPDKREELEVKSEGVEMGFGFRDMVESEGQVAKDRGSGGRTSSRCNGWLRKTPLDPRDMRLSEWPVPQMCGFTHQDVDRAVEAHDVVFEGGAAGGDHALDPHVLSHLLDDGRGLQRQLSCRHQDQHCRYRTTGVRVETCG